MHKVETFDRDAHPEVQRLARRQGPLQSRGDMRPDVGGFHFFAHVHEHGQMTVRSDVGEHGVGEGGPQMKPQHGLSVGGHLGEGQGCIVPGEWQREQGRGRPEVRGTTEDRTEGLATDPLLERGTSQGPQHDRQCGSGRIAEDIAQ